jgi:nucleotide-binding universal stress UspA family protein
VSTRAAALVVGRRGPGSMPAALLGSVSRAVVQHAHCPVFLVG